MPTRRVWQQEDLSLHQQGAARSAHLHLLHRRVPHCVHDCCHVFIASKSGSCVLIYFRKVGAVIFTCLRMYILLYASFIPISIPQPNPTSPISFTRTILLHHYPSPLAHPNSCRAAKSLSPLSITTIVHLFCKSHLNINE